MNRTTKRIGALGTAIVAVAGTCIAFAAWTANGSGPGSSQALTSVDSVVSADTATADLYPGAPAGAVFFKITNTNPYDVTFTKITSISVVSDDTANCPTLGNVSVPAATVNAPIVLATGVSVPAHTTAALAVSRSIPGLVTLDHGAPDGCQGKTFTTTLTLLGMQD
jgi:hypothetical protein